MYIITRFSSVLYHLFDKNKLNRNRQGKLGFTMEQILTDF